MQDRIQRLQRIDRYLSIRIGDASEQNTMTTRQLAMHSDVVNNLLGRLSTAYPKSDLRYLCGLLLVNRLSPLALFGLLSILVDDALPSLDVDDVSIDYSSSGIANTLVLLHPHDITDVSHFNARQKLEHLGEMIEAHGELLIPMLNAFLHRNGIKLGARAFWLILADQIASQAIYAAGLLKRSDGSPALVDALVNRDGSLMNAKTGVLQIEANGSTGYFVERSSCCFIYLARDMYGNTFERCHTCPAHTLNERISQLLYYLGMTN